MQAAIAARRALCAGGGEVVPTPQPAPRNWGAPVLQHSGAAAAVAGPPAAAGGEAPSWRRQSSQSLATATGPATPTLVSARPTHWAVAQLKAEAQLEGSLSGPKSQADRLVGSGHRASPASGIEILREDSSPALGQPRREPPGAWLEAKSSEKRVSFAPEAGHRAPVKSTALKGGGSDAAIAAIVAPKPIYRFQLAELEGFGPADTPPAEKERDQRREAAALVDSVGPAAFKLGAAPSRAVTDPVALRELLITQLVNTGGQTGGKNAELRLFFKDYHEFLTAKLSPEAQGRPDSLHGAAFRIRHSLRAVGVRSRTSAAVLPRRGGRSCGVCPRDRQEARGTCHGQGTLPRHGSRVRRVVARDRRRPIRGRRCA